MIDDLLQLTVGQRLFDDTVQNVLFYKEKVSPNAGPAEEDLVTAFISDVIPAWKLAVSFDLKFECIQVQKVFPLPVRNSFDTFLTGEGAQGGDTLPARNCALIQKFNPAVTGKGKKGRVYISGINEVQATEGRLRSTEGVLLTTLANLMVDLLTGPNSGEFEPIWVTRGPGDLTPITGDVLWTNSLVKPIMASQKRRVTPINSFQP